MAAVEYCKRDASEAVLLVFRDGSPAGSNHVKLRGLDESADYLLTSLNLRPGREKTISGMELVNTGIKVNLPDPYLSTPDCKIEDYQGDIRKDMEKQIQYGSDVIILIRIN